MNLSNFITLREAAELLGVTAEMVRRYVASGQLPSVKVHARLWMVPRRDVERFVRPKVGRPAN